MLNVHIHRGTPKRYRGREIISVIWSAKTPDFCNFFAGIEISGQKYPIEMVGKVFEVRVQKKCFAQQRNSPRLPTLARPKDDSLLIPFLSPISIV